MKHELRIMRKKQTSLGISLLIILTSLFLIPYSTPVSAQGIDLSVSPPIFQIELLPPANAKAEQQLTVENTGSEPLVLDLVFRAFESSTAENGTLSLLDSTKPIPGPNPRILERITILENGEPITRLRLAPGQQKKLDLQIIVPKDEPPADYYLTLIFLAQQTAGDDKESTTAITTGGVGVNLLLSVGPQSQTSGILEEFSTPFFQEHGPVPFTVKLTNTSSHFIYPEGMITIKNMFGQTIEQIELLPVNILAHSTRALPSAEQFQFLAEKDESRIRSQESGEDDEEGALDSSFIIPDSPTAFWDEHFLLGPYTATLELALSDQGPLIVRKIHFIGFPLYLVIGFGVALIIVVFIRSRLKKRHL